MYKFLAINIFNTDIRHLSRPRRIQKNKELAYFNKWRCRLPTFLLAEWHTTQVLEKTDKRSRHLPINVILPWQWLFSTSYNWMDSLYNIGQLQRREKNEQDKWILSWTILTLNHSFGFILIYTEENGSFWMDKLRTQATFK